MDISKIENQFEKIRYAHYEHKNEIFKGLDVVKKFIIDKKLIIVGGMAIDYNLKIKGETGIYTDDEIPDYDVYSWDNEGDSAELRTILCKEFNSTAERISAVHLTTFRVKVHGVVVCDLTYMPKEIYNTIHTQVYDGLNIIHPWYTMSDQFRSLSLPYENPPNENIVHRWDKDIKRFKLLYDAYPFSDNYHMIKNKKIETISDELPRYILNEYKDFFVCGWPALLYIHSISEKKSPRLDDLIKKYNLFYEEDKGFTIPKSEFVLFTKKFDDISQIALKHEDYNIFINLQESKLYESKKASYRIYNTEGIQYTMYDIEKNKKKLKHF